MDTESKVEGLRSAARQALEAQDKLLHAWRSLTSADYNFFDKCRDIDIMKQLVWRRIYPINAFAVLVKIDKYAALDLLLTLYLGDTVDPDAKFGGYVFELSSMLDDLREACGETVLRELINHPKFNKRRLNDSRVVEAFTDSLDIDPTHFIDWLKS
jgi:hypothetical protein